MGGRSVQFTANVYRRWCNGQGPSAPSLSGFSPFDFGKHIHFYYLALALIAAVYLLPRIITALRLGRLIAAIRRNKGRTRKIGFPVATSSRAT